MYCLNCSKLVFLPLNKKCIKCQGIVKNNISVLCETCSSQEKICSSCLKKIYQTIDNPHMRHILSGCKACGRG